jgi:hypothetical protein
MPLKATYDTLNDVPENVRDHYTSQDGKFVLNVEGMVTDQSVQNLKSALEAQRREAAEQKKIASSWLGLKTQLKLDDLTPEKVVEVFAGHDKLKQNLEEITKDERRAIDVAVAERVQTLNQSFEAERKQFGETLKAQIERGDKFEGIYRDNLFLDYVKSTVKDLVHETAIQDLAHRAKLFGWQLTDEGNIVAINNRGEPIYSSMKPDQTITLDEWARTIAFKEAPHMFKQSTGTGDPSKPGFVPGSLKRSTMSSDAKTKFIDTHGLDAFKSLPA